MPKSWLLLKKGNQNGYQFYCICRMANETNTRMIPFAGTVNETDSRTDMGQQKTWNVWCNDSNLWLRFSRLPTTNVTSPLFNSILGLCKGCQQKHFQDLSHRPPKLRWCFMNKCSKYQYLVRLKLETVVSSPLTNLQQAAICPQCLCLHENSPAGLSGMCKDLIIEQALGKIGMSVVLKHSSWPWGVSESWYRGWGWYENSTELEHDYITYIFWANDSQKHLRGLALQSFQSGFMALRSPSHCHLNSTCRSPKLLST